MLTRRQLLGIFLILALVVTVACAPTAAPSPSTTTAEPAWQQEWNKVVAAAKVEGKLIGFTTGSAGEREAMMRGMKEKYGIAAELTNMMPRELTPRIQAERRAGLYLNDVYIGGYASLLRDWRPAAIIEPFDSSLILPDVTDPERIKKVWYRGQLGWVDKENFVMVTTLQPGFPTAINTKVVQSGEIKSFRDLLNPKWKGKIVINDPTLPGGPQEVWGAVMVIMGEDFLRELAKTEPTVLRDQRLALDWLAQGKVAVVFGPDSDTVIDFERTGAPVVGMPMLAEGGYISASASGLARFTQAPNANAATVFINWLTSKEGQELYAKGGMYHSLREDVSTTHLDPKRTRQPGAKYTDVSSETSKLTQESKGAKLATEILGPLMKK